MKKLFLLGSACCLSLYAVATISYWDGGGGDNQWSTAANWNTNIVPVAGDEVILDNSLLTGSYSVILPSGVTTVSLFSLKIAPSGSFQIDVTLPATNTANPGLDITGSGDALVLQNNGVFKNSSGAAPGATVQVAGLLRINNGGRYIHNTTRANQPIMDRLSSVAGTEQGIVEFMVPGGAGYTLALQGRVFGSVILSVNPGDASKAYLVSGAATATIRGDLVLHANTSLSSAMSGDMRIDGDLLGETGTLFSLQSNSHNNHFLVAGDINWQGNITEQGSGFPVLECVGTANQLINLPGGLTNQVTWRINNPLGVTLLSPVTVAYQMDLTNGKIVTSSGNMLTLADGSFYTGGSTASFVAGPMCKQGDDAFIFPIGKGEIYAPAGFTNIAGHAVADMVTLEYMRKNPRSSFGAAVAPGQDHTSFVEYWDWQQTGNATRQVSLAVHPLSFSFDIDHTYVAQWDGTAWNSLGSTVSNAAISGIYETGTITATLSTQQPGPFTLISDRPVPENPLPLQVIDFSVKRMNSTSASISILPGGACQAADKLYLQRAVNGGEFIAINEISCQDMISGFTVADHIASDHYYRYRLLMINEDGRSSFSSSIVLPSEEELGWSVAPCPVKSSAALSVKTLAEGIATIGLLRYDGVLLRHWKQHVFKGNNRITIDLSGLPPGLYFIKSRVGDRQQTIKIIKQD